MTKYNLYKILAYSFNGNIINFVKNKTFYFNTVIKKKKKW